MNIECPPSMQRHAQKVLDGEYDVPYRAASPVIIDIGANVGSFALWAIERWPGCHVHCFEPLPDNFELLQRNLRHATGRVTLNKIAIGDESLTRMFLGRNNCGEASLYDVGEQTDISVEVVTRSPAILPPAQIIKIDAEGAEVDILARMPAIEYDVVMLEYHGEARRRQVDALLQDYLLIGGEIRCLHRGSLKYLHRRLVNPE